MNTTHRLSPIIATLAIAISSAHLSAQTIPEHPFGWQIHRGANNQLKADFLYNLIHRMVQRHPNYPGWLANTVPFEEVDWTDPGLDIYPIDPGTQIIVEMGAIDPAFTMRDPNDLTKIYPTGSEFFVGIGGTNFQTYPWWYIDKTDPLFDPEQEIWKAQFRFVDLTGTHDPSQWYDPAFLARPWVPAPGGAAVLSMLGLGFAARRRR